MTHVYENAEDFAEVAIHGYCDVHARLVRPVTGGVVRSTKTPDGKVALVIGGGSGHYPAFAGYVGPGFADAAVAGDVFASPATRLIDSVSRKAARGGGIILGFGNYAGDVLNFGFAAERLRAQGHDVRVLPITDDVASAGAEDRSRRRGVAGDITIFKIAGAAAEGGLDIDEVDRLARHANARTSSFGVAFGGCTLPGAKEPLFSVPNGKMGVGLGIHGEPGIDEVDIMRASELAALLVDRLLIEKPARDGGRAAVILNGLGGTKYEELFVLWTHIAALLRKGGVEPVAPLVGEYVTSLDMEGCSLTLTWLDAELEPLWLAPCDTAALRVGEIMKTQLAPALAADDVKDETFADASAASRAQAGLIARCLERLAEALQAAEPELGRIDAQAGDGDHGQGMTRGSRAAAAAGVAAAKAGAGVASTLAAASDAWADRAGGTSGAIWGLGLRSAAGFLDDHGEANAKAVAAAVSEALAQVMRLGGAKPGDKTLVDAFAPFAKCLAKEVEAGADLRAAWAKAADASKAAAEATAFLAPGLGRARLHAERSRGYRDAGAVSFALSARTVLED